MLTEKLFIFEMETEKKIIPNSSFGSPVLRAHGTYALPVGGNLGRKPISTAATPRFGAALLLCCSCEGWRAERFSSLWTPRGELDAPGLPAQHRCVVRTVGSFCVVAKRAALRQSVRGHAVARADIDRSSALCLVFLLRRGFRRGSEIATSRCVPSHCVAHFE